MQISADSTEGRKYPRNSANLSIEEMASGSVSLRHVYAALHHDGFFSALDFLCNKEIFCCTNSQAGHE
jgi:hypothetical protein